jgi:hypothetical protein
VVAEDGFGDGDDESSSGGVDCTKLMGVILSPGDPGLLDEGVDINDDGIYRMPLRTRGCKRLGVIGMGES